MQKKADDAKDILQPSGQGLAVQTWGTRGRGKPLAVGPDHSGGLTLPSSREHSWHQAEPSAIVSVSVVSSDIVFSGLPNLGAPNFLLCDFGLAGLSACLYICIDDDCRTNPVSPYLSGF